MTPAPVPLAISYVSKTIRVLFDYTVIRSSSFLVSIIVV